MNSKNTGESGTFFHAFLTGIDQFNNGQFFEAHETWEEIWLKAAEPEKTFLQGMIQIAAAFHHHRKGNVRGMRSLLLAGLKKLNPYPPNHQGIALDALRTEVAPWCAELAENSDPDLAHLPKIKKASAKSGASRPSQRGKRDLR